MYAVVDVETTGFNAGRHDRIAEIAIVRVDPDGLTEDTWTTLVNPMRDLGPQDIHGINAADARRAPTFNQIAPLVAQLLRGRVLVAHNLPFDSMFLAAEFQRLGATIPPHTEVGLCTMRLAGHLLPSGRSLADCCQAAGIRLTNAHSALHDALAAAGLLSHYLNRVGRPEPWSTTLQQALAATWPILPNTPPVAVTRTHPAQHTEHFLSRLASRLPRTDQPNADSYLELLDRALIDRVISDTEADDPVAFADHLGLHRDDAATLHRRYLHALAITALADGILTEEELKDLVTVASLLGLSHDDVDSALKSAKDTSQTPTKRAGRFSLAPGDTIVLTGTFTQPKERIAAELTAAGLVVADSLTKKTRLLVAADVDSMSGKAAKARQYGIPVVGEPAMRRLAADLQAGLRVFDDRHRLPRGADTPSR